MRLTNINIIAQSQIDKVAEVCARLKPMVVISCITYNHENYIREALEGFVMQKTDFPFVAIVHDDASTDKTAEIIREYSEKYPDLILPIYESENQYSKRDGSISRIMYMAREATGAKYIAYCEGDDYWIDPLKLQKQVGFLEDNPEYSLACSSFDKYFQEENRMQFNNRWGKHGKLTFCDIFLHNSIATLTIVIPARLYNGYMEFSKGMGKLPFGDYPLWLYAASLGPIMKFAEETAVYRVLKQSASHFSDNKEKLRWARAEFSMFDFFAERVEVPKSIYREALFNRCNTYSEISVAEKDLQLIQRISQSYLKNKFFTAWLSFRIMTRYPKFKFISDFIESHLSVKAPILYLKNKHNRNKF